MIDDELTNAERLALYDPRSVPVPYVLAAALTGSAAVAVASVVGVPLFTSPLAAAAFVLASFLVSVGAALAVVILVNIRRTRALTYGAPVLPHQRERFLVELVLLRARAHIVGNTPDALAAAAADVAAFRAGTVGRDAGRTWVRNVNDIIRRADQEGPTAA